VALEFQIYLIFPPLVWLWNRIGGIAATAVAVFAVGLGSFALHFSPVKILFFDYIALFCLGVAACAAATSDIAPWPAIRRRVPWRSITLLAFAALVLLNIFFNEADRAALLCEPLVGIFSAALLVTLSISPRSLLRNCVQWKPIVFVGTFSYSLYLIHAPLIQLIWQYALKPAHLGPVTVFFLLLSVGSVIILGISYGFFILCERPFLIPARSSARADLPAVPAI
jgi:peptidoglycan/LPS O-acetylase OafA/YrhL